MSVSINIHAANNPIRARVDQHNSFVVTTLSVIGDEVKFFTKDVDQVKALIDALTEALAAKKEHKGLAG